MEDLAAAEQAGLLGKPRDGLEPREAQSDAFETSQAALDAEYAKATDPDYQPPLIDPPMPDGPLISEADTLVPPGVPEAAVKAVDAYLATRTGVPDAATFALDAAQNAANGAQADGPVAQGLTAVTGMIVDAAKNAATPPGTVDINVESIADDTKQSLNTAIETTFGADSADDQGPIS